MIAVSESLERNTSWLSGTWRRSLWVSSTPYEGCVSSPLLAFAAHRLPPSSAIRPSPRRQWVARRRRWTPERRRREEYTHEASM